MVGQLVRCRIFVGRRKELAALDAARKSLAQSSGSFVLISGEAGIGKTRLLNEFLGLSHNRRLRNVVNTECLQRAQQPLGPIRSLLRALVPAITLAAMPATVVRALAQVIPEELPRKLVTRNADFVLEKEQLFAALLDFLRLVCAKRATILTVEDLHWSDDSTLDFLVYLAHRMDAMRLLIVVTCRSDELEGNERLLVSMSPLFREPHLRLVTLEPLASRELRALVDGTVVGRDPLPEHVARDIEERSEGNPFFAEELVKDFIEHGAGGKTSSQLPLSIRAAIAQRLTNLSADEREVLAYAAVLGQRFDPTVLAVVMGRDPAALSPALRRARELNLIVDVGRDRLSCRFRHALTRQTIYEDVPSFEARKLHEQILATLETQTGFGHHIEELAYHAWEAGDDAKTVRYNERAGDEAFSMRTLPEASTCFQRALKAATDSDDRARLYERIGALERLQGHYRAARDAFEAAFAIRLEREEFDAAAILAASVTGQRYNVGDQSALEFAERFLEEHQSAIGRSARDHLLVVCARVASAFCDFQAAERFLDSVSDPATLAPGVQLNYLIVQMMRHSYDGNVKEWKRNAARVDQLFPQLSPESAVGIENALALTGIYIAANEQIERALERAERVEREWGLRGQRLYGVATKAAYLYQRGRLHESRRCVEEVAKNQDVAPPRRIAAAVAAYLSIAFGDDALWRSFDPDILREAREKLDDPDCVFILGAHAALLATRGALGAAQVDLRAAIGTFSYTPPEAMYILLSAARFLPTGELARVSELVDAAAQTGDTGRATQALVGATIAGRMGKAPEAEALGMAAARFYASLGWPLLQANALELAGKRETALAIYERRGAVADVRRLAAPVESASSGALALLSSRESEVAALVARGLRNTEIAKRLNIGSKTVEKHLASVFRKLGFSSRSQVVAFITGASQAAM